METLSYTIDNRDSKTLFLVWDGLEAGAEGADFALSNHYVRSLSVKGTLDGASVFIEGSNDGTVPSAFFPLCDEQGNVLCFSVPGIGNIAGECFRIRPCVEGGTLNTKITVTVLLRSY